MIDNLIVRFKESIGYNNGKVNIDLAGLLLTEW